MTMELVKCTQYAHTKADKHNGALKWQIIVQLFHHTFQHSPFSWGRQTKKNENQFSLATKITTTSPLDSLWIQTHPQEDINK